jgi:hypothetical protein
MTATPHNGKDEDFQLFLSLLDSDRFYGRNRDKDGSHKVDASDLMRRMVKEELVKFDGTPLFPERRAYTVNYKLSDIEAALYQSVTHYVQTEMGKAYGRDFSGFSESITLDSIEYFLFPNSFFFPGLSLPMVYRFRPDKDDLDVCYFDLLILRPRPLDGEAPPPPDVMELDVDDSYTLAKGLGGLGRVYDQDTANMAAQTRGFRSSVKRGQTLGNYQESRARHLQQRVREYLTAGGYMPPS